MRRTHLRGRENVGKRYTIQAAAFNLGLLLRKRTGAGKPKEAAGIAIAQLLTLLTALLQLVTGGASGVLRTELQSSPPLAPDFEPRLLGGCRLATLATGC